jgi:phospholipase/carboxylesterase
MLKTHLIPATQAGSKRLLVMLHGLGDSTDGYLWMPEALRLPWLNYLLVNAPDSYYGGWSWYDFEGDIAPGVRRSRAALFEVLDAARAQGFPTEQTTFGGFSQGCVMTLEIGCRYPHRFAGVVGISGYVCEPQTLVQELSPLAKEQRFLVTHGRWDPLLLLERSRKHTELLQAAGLNVTWREFAKDHTIAQDELGVIREFVQAGYAPATPTATGQRQDPHKR